MRSEYPYLEISIHALLTESDDTGIVGLPFVWEFLSTLSLRRATFYLSFILAITQHFYPRSPYGERLVAWLGSFFSNCISIHALLTESDLVSGLHCEPDTVFLSTLSLRRATTSCQETSVWLHISIHALLTESDPRTHHGNYKTDISIHALLTESDGG